MLDCAATNAASTAATATTTTAVPPLPSGMDPTYYALSLLRRHRLDECVRFSTHHLTGCNAQMQRTPLQQEGHEHHQPAASIEESLWLIRTKALTMQNWFDDIDVDDDGVDEVLLDGEQTILTSAPRPGTSLHCQMLAGTHGRVPTGTAHQGRDTARPISSRYGYARPGTRSNQTGTASVRPLTSRLARLGTASMHAPPSGSACVNVQKLDLETYAREKPILAKLLCDFLLHVEHRPRMVLELGTAALEHQQQRDWWWMSRLGQACYRLGLLREAGQHFKAALSLQNSVVDALRLSKVFVKMDQPLSALEVLAAASGKNPMDHQLLLCMARLYEQLQDTEKSFDLYRRVLQLDSSNVESIACIAAHLFYKKEQPELSLRLYRRLLQMGLQTTELWNNLGLCCFHSSQYDIALSCLQRALAAASDDNQSADVWYNIGHVGIRIGDLSLAHRAFKLALGFNPRHAEALNNLAVLKLRMGKVEEASNDLVLALAVLPEQHESLYNSALLSFKAGDLEKAYKLLSRALVACPDHPESVALQATLRLSLAAL